VVIASALTLGFAVRSPVVSWFSPSLRPVSRPAEELNVCAGDYSQRYRVQDDDLARYLRRFQPDAAGLAERNDFSGIGTYVDPALAARLLEQGDDVFTGSAAR